MHNLNLSPPADDRLSRAALMFSGHSVSLSAPRHLTHVQLKAGEVNDRVQSVCPVGVALHESVIEVGVLIQILGDYSLCLHSFRDKNIDSGLKGWFEETDGKNSHGRTDVSSTH